MAPGFAPPGVVPSGPQSTVGAPVIAAPVAPVVSEGLSVAATALEEKDLVKPDGMVYYDIHVSMVRLLAYSNFADR